MGIITTIIVGLIVGAIARLLMPGDQKMGWILTCLLGIGGSLIAGFVGQALGWYAVGEPVGWFAAVRGGGCWLVGVAQRRTTGGRGRAEGALGASAAGSQPFAASRRTG